MKEKTGIDLITEFQQEIKNGVTERTLALFQQIVYNFYNVHKREFPWRETCNPYHILVSEVMLQQTQTDRVVKKYNAFLNEFPTIGSLAEAPFRKVLAMWKGLGYNRRAMALKKTAERIVEEFHGDVPSDPDTLITFPGIGKYTASAVVTFAFNIPLVFIETNIRTVFIYFFFPQKEQVKDNEIYPLVKKTLDRSQPREWYYALMDYGVVLKKRHAQLHKKSAQYRKQAPFKGSDREIRGIILDMLLKQPCTPHKIAQSAKKDPSRITKNLVDLEKEGLIKKEEGKFVVV